MKNKKWSVYGKVELKRRDLNAPKHQSINGSSIAHFYASWSLIYLKLYNSINQLAYIIKEGSN